jgi:hypothetical protein
VEKSSTVGTLNKVYLMHGQFKIVVSVFGMVHITTNTIVMFKKLRVTSTFLDGEPNKSANVSRLSGSLEKTEE